MKVLSIKEPYASLINDEKKCIETRSFKTNYRGELYIHASASMISKKALSNEKLMSFLDNTVLNYEKIICKCNLVDCIYMDESFINKIKTNEQEFICGEYKIGRYAWILDDIEPLKQIIPAKGSLNIWNYYTEEEIMALIENVDYGWVDKKNNKHNHIDNLYAENYKLQSPQELIKSRLGVCWDQVELERYYFKNHICNCKTYSIIYYDKHKCPTHTFLTYEKDNSFYWFEHSWKKYKGIHEYDSLKDLLEDVQNKFVSDEVKTEFNKLNLCIYDYPKPQYGIGCLAFYKHCESGKKINVDKL